MTDLETLRELYREKLADVARHLAGAKAVRQYDANNTYQYVINREETQLSWVAAAVSALGGTVDDLAVADVAAPADARAIEAEDVRQAQAFVDRWRAKADTVQDARYGRMINVILGETLEQKRFFEQALEGRLDLLGTRSEAAGIRVGEVLATRWIE
ncbi:MAG TPA: hypothetical protein VHZ73_02275 [Vicinamibacterales bacterium]|nr:hypothetical protein [Vicinamibacterales bacterium]